MIFLLNMIQKLEENVLQELSSKNLNIRFLIDKLAILWMNLGYFVVLEYQKNIKELKNTKVDINNLVSRDFDNK